MKLFANKWIAVILTLLIILTAVIILHLFLIGGIEARLGGSVLGTGKVKLSIHKLGRPFFLFLVLLILKFILARPDPLLHFRRWFERNRRTVVLGLMVLVVASIPRFCNLGGHSVSADELLWIDKGKEIIVHWRVHEFKRATANLAHPGIVPAALIGASYLYLGKDTSPFSFNLADPVIAARLPMAFLGALTCLLLYLLTRAPVGDTVSFGAAFFLALFPEHIAASRVAQLDGTLSLFFMLSLLCYLNYTNRMLTGWKVASAIFFALAMLTKVPALLIPIILAFWKACACLYERREKLRFWEASDLGWLGIGFGGYFLLFTKLWYEPYESVWSGYTYVSPLAAVLNRIVDSIACWPWLQAAAGLAVVYALILMAKRAARGSGRRIGRSVPGFLTVVLCILLCLAFIQVLKKPILNEIRHLSAMQRVGDMGHIKYWMGSVVYAPPRWFYAFMLSIRMQPLMLFFLAFGLVRSCGVVWRRERSWQAYLLFLAAFAIFAGVMSGGNKMAIRYLTPVFPFVCLLSGAGCAHIADSLGSLIAQRANPAGIVFVFLAGVLAVGALVVPLRIIAPDYDIYCNSLVGGPAGATRFIMPGGGVGIREAVEFIKAHAKMEDAIFALGVHGEVRYYWERAEPRDPFRVLINDTKPPHVDWIVIPLTQRLRYPDNAIMKLSKALPPVYSVVRCGVDFMDVYRVEEMTATDGRRYEAEDLKSDLGKEVVDDRALNGGAIRGEGNGRTGMLLYGPYERYGPGQWRAVFRLRGGLAPGGEPIARILVSGVSADDVLASRELRQGDFQTGDEYRDFLIDFSLDHARRLQFCVYSTGTADVWVDRVTVERR
ncbi:MAG: glycosyltransferase family 39 protein [Candidatus Aureabacteria bacterium]|nr:glycosyltransferase family 39 protein [Candidatus Auribacterota bacterium]